LVDDVDPAAERLYKGDPDPVARVGRSDPPVLPVPVGRVASVVRASAISRAERRLTSATVEGATSRSASSPRRPSSMAITGVISRVDRCSTPLKTRRSSSAGRTLDGGAVFSWSAVTTPTWAPRSRSARSPLSTSRGRWGLAKSRSETTFHAARSISATRTRPSRSRATSCGRVVDARRVPSTGFASPEPGRGTTSRRGG